MLTSSSPWLFAGCHVLRRQSVPGHPPCALISLITFQKVCRPLSECCFAFLCLLLSLFAFSRSVQLSRCVIAIPEDDIVFQTYKTVSIFFMPVSLRPANCTLLVSGSLLILLLSGHRAFRFRFSLSRSESTSGYEIRQDLMSP